VKKSITEFSQKLPNSNQSLMANVWLHKYANVFRNYTNLLNVSLVNNKLK